MARDLLSVDSTLSNLSYESHHPVSGIAAKWMSASFSIRGSLGIDTNSKASSWLLCQQVSCMVNWTSLSEGLDCGTARCMHALLHVLSHPIWVKHVLTCHARCYRGSCGLARPAISDTSSGHGSGSTLPQPRPDFTAAAATAKPKTGSLPRRPPPRKRDLTYVAAVCCVTSSAQMLISTVEQQIGNVTLQCCISPVLPRSAACARCCCCSVASTMPCGTHTWQSH